MGCTTTTTSGVSYSVGGTAGWNQMQGLYAALSGGVDFTNSQTLACPDMIISNQSNPDTATPSWSYKQGQNYGNNSLVTFYNQWIWQVDWASYTPAQSEQQVSVASQAAVTYVTLPFPPSQIPVTANLTTVVPLPFGDTFALQPPTVASVSPTCVVPGQGFAIAGSGLYPNLVTGVTIGGVDAPQYAATSDTAVSVVAPVVSQATGQYPVAVQTAQGVSNTNVEIEIPSDGQCP